MTEEVKFIRGNDRIRQLAQQPDIAEGVARVRAEMARADRTYAMGLAALRQAAERQPRTPELTGHSHSSMRGTRQVRRRYTSGPHATATVSGSRPRKWCTG
jgi:hypothetical protein